MSQITDTPVEEITLESKKNYSQPKVMQVDIYQPQVVSQQPQVDVQQPQVVSQQPQVDVQQPQVVSQQPQVVSQQPQVAYVSNDQESQILSINKTTQVFHQLKLALPLLVSNMNPNMAEACTCAVKLVETVAEKSNLNSMEKKRIATMLIHEIIKDLPLSEHDKVTYDKFVDLGDSVFNHLIDIALYVANNPEVILETKKRCKNFFCRRK
jgi:hypothetical protein